MANNKRLIRLDRIRIDGGTQQRALDTDTVAEYAALIRDESTPPPGIVFNDGRDNWLAEGFHRYHAHRAAGRELMECEVRTGTQRDAILYSLTEANARNGLPLTNTEKRHRVETILKDPEWSRWTDGEISRRSGVTRPMVTKLRASLGTVTSEAPTERTYITKHGTVATMNVANIGRRSEPQEPPPEKVEPRDPALAPEPAAKPKPAAAEKPAPAEKGKSRAEDPPAAKGAKGAKGKTADAAPVPLDQTGWPIPAKLQPKLIDGRERVTSLLSAITALGKQAADVINGDGGEYIDPQEAKDLLGNFRRFIAGYVPHAVCRHCGGRGCKACEKRGWLPKLRFEQTTPKELLDMRPPVVGGKGAA
jgi:hypothetical protein